MSTIEVYVIKPFQWSEDGYTPRQAEVHATFHLPERLFDGLNREGYVRRSIIGDGHVTLHPEPAEFSPTPASDGASLDAEAAGIAIAAGSDGASITTISTAAPIVLPAAAAEPVTPAAATESDTGDVPNKPLLTPKEEQALADGSWEGLPFFTKRAIAIKLSKTPVKTGDDVEAAIKAELARRKAA